jgi:CheY-like chemotaxis protein
VSNRSILFIDDNDVDNFIHRRLVQLSSVEFEPHFCTNGLVAIDYLKECLREDRSIDLIFLDIDMPVMNGMKFLKEYLRLPEIFRNKIKLFVLTSSALPIDSEILKAIGLKDFLKKPLKQSTLIKIIEESGTSTQRINDSCRLSIR